MQHILTALLCMIMVCAISYLVLVIAENIKNKDDAER